MAQVLEDRRIARVSLTEAELTNLLATKAQETGLVDFLAAETRLEETIDQLGELAYILTLKQ
jgi:hypothetical protein